MRRVQLNPELLADHDNRMRTQAYEQTNEEIKQGGLEFNVHLGLTILSYVQLLEDNVNSHRNANIALEKAIDKAGFSRGEIERALRQLCITAGVSYNSNRLNTILSGVRLTMPWLFQLMSRKPRGRGRK